MKAIVVVDGAAGAGGMKLLDRPEPKAAINDVIVQVYASGFVGTELDWPSTWVDRLGINRTPTIPGHELAGVVTVLGYGTTGLSVGQRVFGLADWYRNGTLAEYVAIESRNLAVLPEEVEIGNAERLRPGTSFDLVRFLIIFGQLAVYLAKFRHYNYTCTNRLTL